MLHVPPYIGLWLLQFLVMVFPVVLFQSLFGRKRINKNVRTVIYVVLYGIEIIICMTFPVSINREYMLDFRLIPLMIGFIYGGYRVGLLLSFLILSYRFVIGGTGFYIDGLGMVLFFLAAFHFILPRSKKWNSTWKGKYPYLLFTISLIFFAAGTQVLDGNSFTKNETIMWTWYTVISTLTLWIMLYLQNTILVMETITEKISQFENFHTGNHMLLILSQQFNLSMKAVKEFISIMQEDSLRPRQADSIKQIEIQMNHADQLLKDYFKFINHHQTKASKGNFSKELENIVNMMKAYATAHQVELVYTSTVAEEVSIKGDQEMLRFAILNIIKNAIEACASNGKVNICLHEMLKEVYIVIEDNGSGIPAHILSQLGQPLPTEKANGTGLGLVSTYKIAESIGGRVEVQTMANKGTIFSLYFPKWAV